LLANFKQYRSEEKYKELVDAVFEVSELLKKKPNMGQLSQVRGVRSIRMPFSFRMYYSVYNDSVEILSLISSKIKPDRNPFE
jgi:hypothetical protein